MRCTSSRESSIGCSSVASSGTIHKYYSAFGRAVAHRVSGNVYYILADHLNSTSGEVNTSGTLSGVQKYYPFGAMRSTSSASTDRLYTGQRREPLIGQFELYDYNARFYSPALGHFLSPNNA